MKKIFFLISSMNIGGIEKSFLNLLSEIPLDKYEIHLGLMNLNGGLMAQVPSYVQIHHITCYKKHSEILNEPPIKIIKNTLKCKKFLKAFILLCIYIINKISKNRYLLYKYILRKEPKFQIPVDLAIAYGGPSQLLDFYICEKLIAPVKCGWIHFDVAKFGIDINITKILYRKYSKIFIVSKNAKDTFDNIFPQLKNKTTLFYNVINSKNLINIANKGESFSDDFDGIKLLTVGRLSQEKGQLLAIHALKNLIDKGYKVRWYFIGDGPLFNDCKKLAQELNVCNFVEFLGAKINPYGYLKDCDIYIQPSIHEGYCITLAEALCFNKSIVSTNFISASELLKNYKNSIIVDAQSIAISEGIIKAISFPRQNEQHDFVQKNDINELLGLI